MNDKFFCVIPAFNEEKTIAEVIAGLKMYTDKIVVVDDGSTDNTGVLAEQGGAVVLRHIINRGQGAALRTGNEYALSQGAEVIIHFDADGQFLPTEIAEIIKPVVNGEADIVFGSRFLSKQSNIPWFKKYIILNIAKLASYFLFGIRLSDPQCGFRVFSKSAAKSIVIEQDGMAHCTEIIKKSLDHNLKIKEVPVTVLYKDFGQNFGGGLRILKDIILTKLLN